MIITCEKCNTSYLVAVESIGIQGRKVKCIKCNHMWSATLNETQLAELVNKQSELVKQENIEQKNINTEEKIAEISASLPALIKPKTSLFLKSIPLMLLILLIMLVGIFENERIIKYFPSTASLYSSLGLYPSNGLIIDDVILKQQNNEYNISCVIKNTNNVNTYIPFLRVEITDNDNNNLVHKKIKTNHALLAPGETYISYTNVNLPNNASYIIVDLGNKWELFLRKFTYFINKILHKKI